MAGAGVEGTITYLRMDTIQSELKCQTPKRILGMEVL